MGGGCLFVFCFFYLFIYLCFFFFALFSNRKYCFLKSPPFLIWNNKSRLKALVRVSQNRTYYRLYYFDALGNKKSFGKRAKAWLLSFPTMMPAS